MAIKTILLLGDPRLYQVSVPVQEDELAEIKTVIEDLHDTLMAFRETYHCGRAVAAPQIGVFKRVIYMNIDQPVPLINPTLIFKDDEQIELYDDCMSFPNLLVKVRRFQHARIEYRDLEWKLCSMELEGDLSELLQHEYDHLDGILATMRAIDNKSFQIKKV